MHTDKFILTNTVINEKPASELLYGNFIELGYGLQVEAMWGEMFFNRSFEKFSPYSGVNIAWFDLWKDPKDHSMGYETDWRKFDWYHSGYEHNSWFAAPGFEGEFHIDDKSTFIINESPESGAAIQLMPGGMHGETFLRIENNGKHIKSGLGQMGKYFMEGKSYKFSGYFKNVKNAGNAVVEFYPEGDWENPLLTFALDEIGDDFTFKEFDFVSNYTGRATFTLWTNSGSVMDVDAFSLMPKDTVGGWRREVIEEAKKLNATVIRWPGGCFASFYDWHNGVGPQNSRIPEPSYFWGGFNYNDVGTLELDALTRSIGAESMVCVNMYHPKKSNYIHGHDFSQFTDIEKGAKEAADWVAYCNAPVTHPMGKLRAEHGRPEPLGIRFWELDNETMRWFSLLEYAEAVKTYSIAMKAVDPTIRIGMVSYAWEVEGIFTKNARKLDNEVYTEMMKQALEIAGPYIDFFADRDRTIDDGNLILKLGLLKDYNDKHGSDIRYCNTEWLAYSTVSDDFNRSLNEVRFTPSYLFSKWEYAMNIFRSHMMWQRAGGDIIFVNFNNFANTHSQCVIDTPKDTAFLTAAGKALSFMAQNPPAWLLRFENHIPRRMDDFQVQAGWDIHRKSLVLYVFNHTEEAKTLEFDISCLGKKFCSAEISTIYADHLHVMNSVTDPHGILEEKAGLNSGITGSLELGIRKHSFTRIVLN